MGFDSRPRWLLERKPDTPRLDRRVLFDFARGAPREAREPDTPDALAGWELDGEAFAAGPVTPERAAPRGLEGARGERVLSSFHPRLGAAARGRARSPAFVVDRDRLAVRIAGGARGSTRIELRVEDEVVRRASGGGGAALVEVVWDVSELRGSRVRLVLLDVDPGPRGFVLLDSVELFDASAR